MPGVPAVALAELVDDASLFPPARLPMAQAVAHHRAARAGPHAWLLGRFLCPASALETLPAEAGSWRLGVVLTRAPEGGAGLDADLEALAAWSADTTTRRVELVELRPPQLEALPALLARLAPVAPACVELPAEAAPEALLTAGPPLAKLRCGGLSAEAFPTPERVAAFIAACADARVPFKATAGLHHPLRRRDEALGVLQHGFLNLLVAAGLAATEGLRGDALSAVVAEADPGAVALDDDGGLRWGERHLDADTLAAARRAFVAFGSCSFTEPVEDLQGLGLLDVGSPA